MPMEISALVAHSYEQGKRALEKRELTSLKKHGQFPTPSAVARYMAKQLGQIKNGDSLLQALQTVLLDEEFIMMQETRNA